MKELEERIRKDGRCLPGDILRVNSFLNHQVDVKLAMRIGEEFRRIFQNHNVTKVLTVEAGGLTAAMATALAFGGVPLVYAKKGDAHNMDSGRYSTDCFSYTRGIPGIVSVAKDYLTNRDCVLIIDDFLANGEAMNAMVELCRQAGADIAGCGAVIEKSYQPGRRRIEKLGIEVHALARVAAMDENGFTFQED